MTEQTKDTKQKTVKIKLNQAHTHQRTPHKANETIEVLPHVADHLEAANIGKRV